MTMKVSREEFLGIDEPLAPTVDTVLFKLMLDFEVDVYMRLKELGLKQKDLAKLLDVSPAAVSKMLSPTGNLSLRTMAKVAVALGCEFDRLKMIGVSDTSYIPLSDFEVLTTLMTEDDPYGVMMDEDLGTIFWTTDASYSQGLTDKTESVEYAFIDFSEEEAKQIEISAVPMDAGPRCVQDDEMRKEYIA